MGVQFEGSHICTSRWPHQLRVPLAPGVNWVPLAPGQLGIRYSLRAHGPSAKRKNVTYGLSIAARLTTCSSQLTTLLVQRQERTADTPLNRHRACGHPPPPYRGYVYTQSIHTHLHRHTGTYAAGGLSSNTLLPLCRRKLLPVWHGWNSVYHLPEL
jgi:hypothetical protein